jgi:hypothetical protein
MAVQQRIIGGGLLLAGIAVVLILIFLFIDRGVSTDEAYNRFLQEIYPAYVKAEEAGDYLAMKRLAGEARALAKETTMAAVETKFLADAAAGNREADGFRRLLESGAFEKNEQGLFGLDGRWYDDRTHSALRRLKRSLEEGMAALQDARQAAKTAAAALEKLRTGSGLELALPPAAADSNPVVAADSALFAVLGLPAADAAKALATKGDGAKAKSARLVWNGDEAAGRARLAQELARIPGLADAIERAAIGLAQAAADLKGRETHADDYVRRAMTQLGAGLDPAGGAAAVADTLKREAKVLKGHGLSAPSLGQALAGGFAE